MIPVPNDIDEADSLLSLHVETGVINDSPLVMLEQMIVQVSLFDIGCVLHRYDASGCVFV